MATLKQCLTLEQVDAYAGDWWEGEKPEYEKHAAIASAPLAKLEPQYWPDRILALADAAGWGWMAYPEVREMEQQALAILTADGMTVARAEATLSRYHRSVKAVDLLAKTADRKLSALQSLNKQR